MPSDDERSRSLPACRRCRIRKIKCDRRAPKCASCSKARAACIIVDPVTSEQYPRDYIRRLELRELELRAKIDAQKTSPRDHETPRSLPSTVSTARPNGFVGDGSGLSFLRHIFSDAKWQAYKPQLLQHLAERTQIPELDASANAQPPIEEAAALLENYFARFHIHHTFLLKQNVLDVFNRVYHTSPSQAPSPQDYFRLFMVFSISAVTRYRKGDSREHPYGYFITAQTYLGGIPLIGTLDAIQNILLVARFGMYYHIGTSLWEISRFCMRQCIEHGLHTRPRKRLGLLEEQHRRRIFWECYILDCYSSGVLGRPFAIAARDIAVDLPIDATDETIQASIATSLSTVDLSNGPFPTELSVFIFCIKLRMITSHIHSEFYTGRGVGSSGAATPLHHVSSGHVYVKLYEFLDELDKWRKTAPIFDKPRSLYERQEWYEFLMEKDKLLLVRGAMHSAPRRNGHPPDDLLVLCLNCATQIIELYNRMLQLKCITWTRSYFQVIFAAGLSIIYCVSLGVHKDAGQATYKQQPARALTLCGNILTNFRREMPDAGRFSIVFEILKENLLRDTSIVATLNFEDGHGMTQDDSATVAAVTSDQLPGTNMAVDQANWNMLDAFDPRQTGTGIPLSPISNDTNGQMISFDYSTEMQPQELLDWPTLTDEMMEHLEAGLGEFAWGAMDTDFHTWEF